MRDTVELGLRRHDSVDHSHGIILLLLANFLPLP